MLEVYTDGSATTANLPGGWAYVLVAGGSKIQEGSGHLDKATNNTAEITAGIRGLEAASGELLANPGVYASVVLISDSQLVLHFAEGTWRCKKYHLQLLVGQLQQLYRKLNAATRWVKGHSGDTYNERCDVLAKAARAQSQGSTSTFTAYPAASNDPTRDN